MGSLHQHHQPLQALRVDGVELHGVLLQGVFVSEPLLTQGTDHIGPFVRLLLPGIFLLVFFLGICKGEMKSDREINAQFNIFINPALYLFLTPVELRFETLSFVTGR